MCLVLNKFFTFIIMRFLFCFNNYHISFLPYVVIYDFLTVFFGTIILFAHDIAEMFP
jgi:hypothetical protein